MENIVCSGEIMTNGVELNCALLALGPGGFQWRFPSNTRETRITSFLLGAGN